MAYSYDLTFLYTPGATLTAEVVDRTGAALGSQPAFTIVEDGDGFYTYYTDALPDGQYGRVRILEGTTQVASGLVTPQESEIGAKVARLLGLTGENWVWDDEVYAGANLQSASIYVYDSAANATAHDGSTGLVAKYAFTATHSGNNPTLAKKVRTV